MKRVPRADFERLAENALARLPRAFRDLLYNVSIEVRAFPRREAGKWDGSPTLLGLYTGLPRAAMHHYSVSGSYLPARIVLYQRNLERASADVAELAARVEETLRHEIAHHLGFDEAGVRRAMRPRAKASRTSARSPARRPRR